MTEGLPPAGSKLRLVLDYLPCEACLSQPVQEQELLCSICRRLDRDVDVDLVTRTTVILERPTPVLPIMVAPAPPAPLPPPEEVTVPEPAPEAPAPIVGVDVVTEPLEAQDAPASEAAPEPAPAAKEAPSPVRGFSLFRRRKEAPREQETPVAEQPPEDFAPTPPPVEQEPVVVEPEPVVIEQPPAEVPPAPPAPAEPAAPAEVEAAPEPELKRGFSLFRRGKKKQEEAPVPPPVEEEPGFDDVVSFTRRETTVPEAVEDDDAFDVYTYDAPPREETPTAAPAAEPAVEEPRRESEFDFSPSPSEEAPEPVADTRAEPERDPLQEALDDLAPREEVRVEPEGASPWAPPAEERPADDLDSLWQDETPEPARVEGAPVEEPIFESEIVPDAPAPVEDEEEIIETEIVELEIIPDDEEALPAPLAAAPPAADDLAPLGDSDLFRLRGFQQGHRHNLVAHRIESISHLSGHDPHELADRTGIPASLLASWIGVADLVHEVGVPLDAALALVAAGVDGPRGLRELPAEGVMDRLEAQGLEAGISERDVKRWKRRA